MPSGKTSIGTTRPVIQGKLISDMLARYGMSAYWYPPQICNCWGELLDQFAMSGGPDPACPTCQGRGFIYPTRYVLDGVFFAKMQHDTEWDESGLTVTGTIHMTVPHTVGGLGPELLAYTNMGFRDVVVPTDITFSMPHIVRRGNDTVRYDPVSVVSCNYGSTFYNYNTDFHIQDRQVVWVGNSPPMNAAYVIQYTYNPLYIVMDQLPVSRNFAHLDFPRTYILEEDQNLADLLVDARPVG